MLVFGEASEKLSNNDWVGTSPDEAELDVLLERAFANSSQVLLGFAGMKVRMLS